MKRATLILLLSAITLSLACQPVNQNGNGNANANANANVSGSVTMGTNEAELSVAGDKTVAISVTDDPTYPIQVSPTSIILNLHPTDPSKHQKIRWCTYNNTEAKTIDWVRIEAKPDPGIEDPFEDRLPLNDNSDISPDSSDCTKKFRPKRPRTGDTFNYRVVVGFKDGTEVSLDPQVVISGVKIEGTSNGNGNGNRNGN